MRQREPDLASIIRTIFRRPIAFHRSLVDLTGSVSAALMLGQACYWDERTDDPEGWFWKTRTEWEAETGLSRWEQEEARKKLRSRRFLQERLSGVPAKIYFRVDFEAIAAAYLKACRIPVGGKTSIKAVEKPPTGRRENLQHYKGSAKNTSKTTTKITQHNDEQRVFARKKLLLSQAEQLMKSENRASPSRHEDDRT